MNAAVGQARGPGFQREPRILLVGHCGIDTPPLTAFLSTKFKAVVEGARNADDAKSMIAAGGFDLALINRVLIGDSPYIYQKHEGSGVTLLRELVASGTRTKLMIVSNFTEAQDAAVALGGVPGFGKRNFEDGAAERIIAAALASEG